MTFLDLPFSEVEGKQIIASLNANLGRSFSEGRLYQTLQEVANESRKQGWLINPNDEGGKRAYNWNTSVMMPLRAAWAKIKRLQWRLLEHLKQNSQENLRTNSRHVLTPRASERPC